MKDSKTKKREYLVRVKRSKNFAYLGFGLGMFWLGWGFYTFSISSIFAIALGIVFIFAGGWELKKF